MTNEIPYFTLFSIPSVIRSPAHPPSLGRDLLTRTLLCAMLFSPCAAIETYTRGTDMPDDASRFTNAIWIFGDQHPAHALSCNGNPNLNTPHLDRLAAEGQNYTQRAVSGFPLCCPFRGSLLTSLYPHECVPGHEYQMPPEMPTIAHAFSEHGYDTAYFGKWHVDGFHEREGRAAMHIIPPERRGGFDTWVGYENNNSQWDCWVHGGEGERGLSLSPARLRDRLPDRPADRVLCASRARRSGAGREQPFFAVLSVQPPHNPYLAPAEWMARHTPGQVQLRPNVPPVARIQAQARRELAGRLCHDREPGLERGPHPRGAGRGGPGPGHHILIFFSDHGDMHGSHGQFRKTCALGRVDPHPLYHRRPAARATKGGRAGCPTWSTTWTLRRPRWACAASTTPDWMRGHDYQRAAPAPGGPQAAAPDSAFLQCVIPTGHGDSVDRPWRGVVTLDGWKYVALEGQPWLMFNLNEDPYELANLAHNTRYRVERKRLQDRLAGWIRETEDSFVLPAI